MPTGPLCPRDCTLFHLRQAYDGVTLKNVLQMSSGVEFGEDYFDPFRYFGGGHFRSYRTVVLHLVLRPRPLPPACGSHSDPDGL